MPGYEGTMQPYQSIIPEKKCIDRLIASPDVDLLSTNILHNHHYLQRKLSPQNSSVTSIYCCHIHALERTQ